jgi:hypothetical protein
MTAEPKKVGWRLKNLVYMVLGYGERKGVLLLSGMEAT